MFQGLQQFMRAAVLIQNDFRLQNLKISKNIALKYSSINAFLIFEYLPV